MRHFSDVTIRFARADFPHSRVPKFLRQRIYPLPGFRLKILFVISDEILREKILPLKN